MQVRGVVFKIYDKAFPASRGKPATTFFSIKLEDNPIYYRTKTERYAGIAEPGQEIEFEANLAADGKSADVVQGSVKKVAHTVGSTGGTDSGAVSNRQNSIEYQSARKDAIAFLGVALGVEAVKLPAKQADKLDALDALLDAYTSQFFSDIAVLGAVARVTANETPQEDAQTEEEEE